MLLPLAGCISASPTILPDGTRGYAIRCNGTARDIQDCYMRAGEMCPGGYDVVNAASESRPFVVASPSGLIGGAGQNRSILVGCRGRNL
jgi:hypothetical protein